MTIRVGGKETDAELRRRESDREEELTTRVYDASVIPKIDIVLLVVPVKNAYRAKMKKNPCFERSELLDVSSDVTTSESFAKIVSNRFVKIISNQKTIPTFW